MKISEINIYPIKSLSEISVKNSIVENRGLQFDRRWMLVNEENKFLTQREFPKMAALKVEIIESGLRIFDKENKMDVSFTSAAPESAVSVQIWNSRVRANVYENKTNEWFGDVLQTNCRLVVMMKEARRRVNYFYAVSRADEVSFADGYPFLLIGENSLKNLNKRLEKEIPMNRFRPNFVISDGKPFEEDNWKKIKIGETVFHLVKPCDRCVITTIDQETGISDGKEPLKTLATYRTPKGNAKKKILFGQNLIAENFGGKIKIGDRIEILEMKN